MKIDSLFDGDVEDKEEVKKEETKNEPSSTIFVKNLNLEVTEKLLQEVYSKFDGFVKLKLLKNYAIIDYDSIENAHKALNETNNKKLTQNCRIQVLFANN